MVGLQTLDLAIGVRVPASQPNTSSLPNSIKVCRHHHGWRRRPKLPRPTSVTRPLRKFWNRAFGYQQAPGIRASSVSVDIVAPSLASPLSARPSLTSTPSLLHPLRKRGHSQPLSRTFFSCATYPVRVLFVYKSNY